MLFLETDMNHTDVRLGFSGRGDAGGPITCGVRACQNVYCPPQLPSCPARCVSTAPKEPLRLSSPSLMLNLFPESSHCGASPPPPPPAFQVLLNVAAALAVWCVLARSLCSQGSEYK